MGKSSRAVNQIETGWNTKKRKIRLVQLVLSHLILAAGAVLFILPFAWLLSTAVKPDSQIFLVPPQWIPHPIMSGNFLKALHFIPFATYLRNTLYICTFNVLAMLLSSATVAYGFAKIKWPGRDIAFIVMLSTMMLPSQVTLIPVFLIFRKLGWIGGFAPLTIPALFGSAFNIFLLRQFYLTIPFELSDAARIDGCTEGQIFWRIVLPLAKPALTVVALFTFIASWNDFMGPLIYLSDERLYTLSLGLYSFQSAHGTEWALLMAASTIMVLPIIILFFFTQRTFIQGIALTGVKG